MKKSRNSLLRTESGRRGEYRGNTVLKNTSELQPERLRISRVSREAIRQLAELVRVRK